MFDSTLHLITRASEIERVMQYCEYKGQYTTDIYHELSRNVSIFRSPLGGAIRFFYVPTRLVRECLTAKHIRKARPVATEPMARPYEQPAHEIVKTVVHERLYVVDNDDEPMVHTASGWISAKDWHDINHTVHERHEPRPERLTNAIECPYAIMWKGHSFHVLNGRKLVARGFKRHVDAESFVERLMEADEMFQLTPKEA